ncbi:hypothetical protein IFM89_010373 [Coptis chinensis]|uniref:Late embryogenesis abundant protein n=1 Tax=Coptis chinensis TaxID=261450 RepID=A0A835IY37_9MAGN|nr:hypothetical protein IFM89_010373 [Coptis chinensis]
MKASKMDILNEKSSKGKMQAVKEKLSDMATMRKVKSDAKAEEQAEKDLAKTRIEVAKEIRKAKEAEAGMDLHVAKAGEIVQKHIEKHPDDLVNAAGAVGIPSSNENSPGSIGSTNPIGSTSPISAPTSNNLL